MVIRALLAAVLACLAAPAAAQAAQAVVSGPQLLYIAGSAEPNQVIVKRVGTTHVITDPGAVITPGALCSATNAHTVTCNDHPTLGVVVVTVVLLDLDDSARVQSAIPASMNGGAGADRLTGGTAGDAINGGTGRGDRLTGAGGADTLTALDSSGDAILLGGAGNDTLSGPNNPDISPGFTRSDGGPGADTLNGSKGTDVLIGGTGADRITGGAGVSDLVRYDERSETVTVRIADGVDNDGGALDGPVNQRDELLGGIEQLVGGSAGDTLTGTTNNEVIYGGPGTDKLEGGSGNDLLCGEGSVQASGSALNVCAAAGTPGDDVLNGDAGNDILQGTLGADSHNGGAGRDRASWSDRPSGPIAVTIDDCAPAPACAAANDGQVDVDPATPGDQGEQDIVSTDVEDVSGTGSADTIGGSAAANSLFGGGGSDELSGLGGDDTLCGDSAGFFAGGPCGLSVAGTAGGDTLAGGTGADLLLGVGGPDTLEGGDGLDTVSYETHNTPVTATISDDCSGTPCALPNDGSAGEGDQIERDVENLTGGSAGDLLRGTGDANVLVGGAGGDRLEGLVGRDVLDPGFGNADIVIGGGSIDFVTYRSRTGEGLFLSIDGVANDGELGEGDDIRTDVEGIMGSDGDDVIVGHTNRFDDTLLGFGGADDIDGRAGDDVLVGGQGADALRGGEGDDHLNSLDEATDPTVDCGDGTADVVQHDLTLDAPAGCETLDPFDAPAMGAARW